MLRIRFTSLPSAGARIITASLLTLTLIALAAGARPYLSGAGAGDGPPALSMAAGPAAQKKKAGRSVETELITLVPNGFEPAEVTRPAGEFILMVENRSGRPADLRFSRVTGERLREVTSSKEEPDWNDLVDLQPGRYLLTDANHPQWACHVTITHR